MAPERHAANHGATLRRYLNSQRLRLLHWRLYDYLCCWHCGLVPAPPPLLQLPEAALVLLPGTGVTSDHLNQDGDRDRVIGMVEAHPADPAAVVLRNIGQDSWTITPDGGSAIIVPPGRRLGVRNMIIEFGAVRGRITVH